MQLIGRITKPPTTDRPPTNNHRPTDRSSTNPPTTDPPTGPPTNHQSPTHRLTDPITIDQQPFDSPILF